MLVDSVKGGGGKHPFPSLGSLADWIIKLTQRKKHTNFYFTKVWYLIEIWDSKKWPKQAIFIQRNNKFEFTCLGLGVETSEGVTQFVYIGFSA